LGRLRTTPSAPSSPWASSSTTVRSKLGSPNDGVATRSWPVSDVPVLGISDTSGRLPDEHLGSGAGVCCQAVHARAREPHGIAGVEMAGTFELGRPQCDEHVHTGGIGDGDRLAGCQSTTPAASTSL